MADEIKLVDFGEWTGSCSEKEASAYFNQELESAKEKYEKAQTIANNKENADGKLKNPDQRNKEKAEAIRLSSVANRWQKVCDAAAKDDANKKLATQFYNIAMAELNNPEEKRLDTQMAVDDKGNICLRLGKQMDGLHGFDFKLTDGRVVFSGEMSDDKLAEALDFLWRHGITNYELPPNASKRAQEINEEISKKGKEELEKGILNKEVEENNQTNAFKATPLQPYGKGAETFEEACDSVRLWGRGGRDKNGKQVDSSIGKKDGLSFFENKGSDKDGQYAEFSVYDSEDPNNYDNDGKRDKNGVRQEKNLQFRVRLYKSKDGHLGGIKYYVPKHGKVPVEVADKIVALVKAQKVSYVNFPQKLTDADAGVFRLACARAGMIPLGINISLSNALKMEREAVENIPDKAALYKFKGKLGRQMLELANGKPDDPRLKQAYDYITQEQLYPVKLHLEGCLTDKLQKRINGEHLDGSNDNLPVAHEVIGAAKTLEQIFMAIADNPNASLEDLCDNLCRKVSPKDKSFKQEIFDKMSKAGVGSQKACELSREQMEALYDVLEPKNVGKAREDLERKLARSPDKYQAGQREVDAAQRALNQTVSKILKDKGFSEGFSTVDFGTPEIPDIPNNSNNRTISSQVAQAYNSRSSR